MPHSLTHFPGFTFISVFSVMPDMALTWPIMRWWFSSQNQQKANCTKGKQKKKCFCARLNWIMLIILQDYKIRTDIRSVFWCLQGCWKKNLIYFKQFFFFVIFPPEFDIFVTCSEVTTAEHPQVAVSGCSYVEIPKQVMSSNSNSQAALS